MSLPLIILDEAEDELKAAADYYEDQSAGLGTELRVEIGRALEQVSSFPRSGKPVPGRATVVELRQVFVRRFPFSVIYLLEPTSIWIVAFAHHRRRPGYWKRRVP